MSTITILQANDQLSDSRSDVNTNFSNLNTDKVEVGGVNGTPARGDILFGKNASPTWEKLTIGSANRYLSSDGTDVSWGQISLSLGVTGTLSVANGGTGQSSYINGQLLIGNTTGNTLVKATLTEGEGIDITNGTGTITILGEDASGTNKGIVELATAAEINTGTDTDRAIPIDQFVASNRNVRYVLLRCIDAGTAVSVDTDIVGDLEFPFTGTITEIGAYTDDAGTTGTMTVDVNLNGTTLMTTNKITIDSTEKSSRTAATAPTLTTTAVTAGDLITVDIDAIHTTPANGLTIRLGIRQS